MLSNSVLLDAGGPLLFVLVGLPIALAAIAVVVGVEAALLRLMRWDASFGRCLLHSLAINAASALVGCGLLFAVQVLTARQALDTLLNAWFVISIILAFVFTVVVEAVLLRALKREGRVPWRMSLAINIASYALLAAFALVTANL